MQQVKKSQPAAPTTALCSQGSKKKAVDPAYEAGLAKVRFYKTDRWEDGYDAKNVYVAFTNTIPPAFSKAFLPSMKPDPVTDEGSYDERLFGVSYYPISTDPDKGLGGAQVRSHLLNAPIADVWFDTDTFVVRLLASPKSGVFPFTADALLKAIYAAKWDVELYVLPKPYDTEPEQP